MIDLHTHSSLSDGSLTPENLILYAKNRGIDILAISDHETIGGFSDYYSFAEKNGVVLIPAVEINVSDYKNFHLVCYGIKNISYLEKFLQSVRQENVSVCRKVLEKLYREYGISFTVDEVRNYNSDKVLDKKAIAKILIDKGYATDTKNAYDEYIGRDAKAYVPIRKITAKEAIDLVHKCGGVVCWAHPSTVRKQGDPEKSVLSVGEYYKLAEKLKSQKLDGLEVFTARSTPEQEQLFAEIAKEYGFITTGGSDFHSHTLGETIGAPKITEKHMQALYEQILKRNNEYDKNPIRDGETKEPLQKD